MAKCIALNKSKKSLSLRGGTQEVSWLKHWLFHLCSDLLQDAMFHLKKFGRFGSYLCKLACGLSSLYHSPACIRIMLCKQACYLK